MRKAYLGARQMLEILPMKQLLTSVIAFVSKHSTNQLDDVGIRRSAPHIKVVIDLEASVRLFHELEQFSELKRLKVPSPNVVPSHSENLTD
jgi:hypothetical protein